MNAAGFIRITRQEDLKTQGKFRAEDEHTYDPLDNTRIHPEDYELARKMAMDDIGYDEDDIQDKHPSWVVGLTMDNPENERKLSELDLDERFTLDLITNEFMRLFAENLSPFAYLSGPEVLTMLSGETTKSLRTHLIVSAVVLQANSRGLRDRLNSGFEGPVEDDSVNAPKTLPQKGQTITTVIRSSTLNTDEFFVHLTLVNSDGQTDDQYERSTLPDLFWDAGRYQLDKLVGEEKTSGGRPDSQDNQAPQLRGQLPQFQ
ncbi:Transcription elongation factor Spt6 [Mycena indigotica]|uniref:Transcription elongation factor Spt6 n=1 Tax=Mycena indigotica TaxID=2126181 RepID=A0A8H6VYL3_9AGAR|nr:Transcription elongation factor Spt6 [Mycena indigotica]KAF7298592.1 Transcription elongation factor Spt6 [Mycena indigotica]